MTICRGNEHGGMAGLGESFDKGDLGEPCGGGYSGAGISKLGTILNGCNGDNSHEDTDIFDLVGQYLDIGPFLDVHFSGLGGSDVGDGGQVGRGPVQDHELDLALVLRSEEDGE